MKPISRFVLSQETIAARLDLERTRRRWGTWHTQHSDWRRFCPMESSPYLDPIIDADDNRRAATFWTAHRGFGTPWRTWKRGTRCADPTSVVAGSERPFGAYRAAAHSKDMGP